MLVIVPFLLQDAEVPEIIMMAAKLAEQVVVTLAKEVAAEVAAEESDCSRRQPDAHGVEPPPKRLKRELMLTPLRFQNPYDFEKIEMEPTFFLGLMSIHKM